MSKKQIKKQAQVSTDFQGITADPFLFDVDPTLKSKIEAEGLTCRWINRANYISNRGDHRGWRPYQLPKTEMQSKGALDFQYGVDPDGYVSRGDLVLAVRPLAMHEASKKRIAMKNKAQQGFQAEAAKKLKEQTGMNVLEGYEDEVKGYKSRGQEDLGDDD
jgi:hypothetical protein